MKYGVDISEYDNKIDYDVFKQQIDFAIIRIGYGIQNRGDQIDKLLDEHYNNLKYSASECIACGDCEERCPFSVHIVDVMLDTQDLFGF